MPTLPFTHGRRAPAWLLMLPLSTVSLLACAAGQDTPAPIPQLTVATGGTLGACAALASFTYPNMVITAATPVAAGATATIDGVTHTLPENCYVQGRMNERTSAVDGQVYAIRWEMRLPKDWNGRLFFQPNGGNEGTLATPTTQAYGRLLGGSPDSTGLARGFAVVTTDSGHDSAANTTVAPGIRSQAFGRDPAARTEHAHGYVATVTPMAKSLVKAAYGKAPDRSYMVGCSNGGRVGMVTAARYPDLFDGILAGAPAFNLPKAVVAGIWNGQQMAAVSPLVGGKADISNSFSQANLDLVAAKVIEQCDALDGLADGMVGDRAACKAAFNLATHVPTCGATPDATCLSAAQKTSLGKMMGGPTDSTGKALYNDWPYEPGMAAAGWRTWQMGNTSNAAGPASASNPTSFIVALTGPSMGFMFTNPPQSPTVVTGLGSSLFDYVMGYSMDSDAAKIFGTGNGFNEAPYSEFTPPDPTDLSKLRNRGAKLLVFHGNADAVFSVNDTLSWYAGLSKTHSDASAFSRVFEVPGMTHCSGGPAADKFDMVTALVDWVETGKAPERVLATARSAALNPGLGSIPTGRSRPLCAHPKVARYAGSGSVEDAASFTCQ